MNKYILTEEQKKNALIFLERVQLTGSESLAWIDLKVALNKPVEEPKEDSVSKEI